jgi:pyruvyltransferase
MKVFWLPCGGNFGDALTAAYLKRKFGITAERTKPEHAFLSGAGSILHLLRGFRGHVVGTGFISDGLHLDDFRGTIHCLRGPLSAAKASVRVPYADFGIIADQLIQEKAGPEEEPIDVLVFPHYVDDVLYDKYRVLYPNQRVVSVSPLANMDTILEVVQRAALVVSSSLHGLVLADSLGIPRIWEQHPGVIGNGFKFRDYAGSYGATLTPGVVSMPSEYVVERMKDTVTGIMEGLVQAWTQELP